MRIVTTTTVATGKMLIIISSVTIYTFGDDIVTRRVLLMTINAVKLCQVSIAARFKIGNCLRVTTATKLSLDSGKKFNR